MSVIDILYRELKDIIINIRLDELNASVVIKYICISCTHEFNQKIQMWQFSDIDDFWVLLFILFRRNTRHSSLSRELSQNIVKKVIKQDTERGEKNNI